MQYLCAVMTKKETNQVKIECVLPTDGTDTVVNLREKFGELVPVGEPLTLATGVAAAWPLADGAHLCADSSRRVLRVCGANGDVYSCGTLRSALTGVAGSGERHWLMTADGPQLLAPGADGRYILTGSLPDFGCVRLRAAVGSRFTETVRLSPLTGGYSRGSGALTDEDSLAVGLGLKSAYALLRSRAALAGQRLQPSLMAWQLVDDHGQVIFRSVPQWAGVADGFQLVDSMTTGVGADGSGGFSVVDPFSISADGWRPEAVISADGVSDYWREHTARLELLAQPAMEFTDGADRAQGRLDAGASGHSSLHVFMPGASAGMVTDTAGLMALTSARLAAFHSEARVVGTIGRPFANPGSHTVGFADAGRPAGRDAMPAQLQLPHRFAAATSFESGMALFMADITVIPSAGGQAVDVAPLTTATAEAIHQVALTLADGTVRARSRSCREKPLRLPPLLVFPEPTARSVTLLAGTEAVELTLTPSACGRYSYWLSPGLSNLEWMPDTADGSPVGTTAAAPRLGGTLLCAAADSPLDPLSAHAVCPGTIRRLTQTVGSAGGWNYGRQHLLLWGSEGVYALSVDRSLLTVGCSLLHRPGITRHDAVAVAADCAWCATSSGTLLKVTGARARAVAAVMEPVAVGWCEARGELWMADADGRVGVLTAAGGFYRRKPLEVKSFCDAHGGRLHALTTDGRLVDCSTEARAEWVEVEWSARVGASVAPTALAVWHLDSEAANLRLALSADSGGAATQLCELTVAGQVNSPLAARVYSPLRTHLTARIGGTLTAPSRLRGVVFKKI